MTAACLGVEDSEDNNLPDFWKKLSCCSNSKKYEAEADKPNSKYLNIDIRYCEENILVVKRGVLIYMGLWGRYLLGENIYPRLCDHISHVYRYIFRYSHIDHIWI